MSADTILHMATGFALVVLSLALLVTAVRVVIGPTLADRVLGLDLLVVVAIGLIAAVAVRTGFTLYVDIALALCLVGFLATVAFARFMMVRGPQPEVDRQASPAAPRGKRRRAGPTRAQRGKRR